MKHWNPTTTRAPTERGGPDQVSDLVDVARATDMPQRSPPALPDVDLPDREHDLICPVVVTRSSAPSNGTNQLRQAKRSRNAVRICFTFGLGLLRIIAPLLKKLAPITGKDLVFCCPSYSVTLITTGRGSDSYPYVARLQSFRVSPWPRHPVPGAQAPYPNCPVVAPQCGM